MTVKKLLTQTQTSFVHKSEKKYFLNGTRVGKNNIRQGFVQSVTIRLCNIFRRISTS